MSPASSPYGHVVGAATWRVRPVRHVHLQTISCSCNILYSQHVCMIVQCCFGVKRGSESACQMRYLSVGLSMAAGGAGGEGTVSIHRAAAVVVAAVHYADALQHRALSRPHPRRMKEGSRRLQGKQEFCQARGIAAPSSSVVLAVRSARGIRVAPRPGLVLIRPGLVVTPGPVVKLNTAETMC